MPEVNVEINGRKYRMACEEGQEAHLGNLAERFNQSIENLKGAFGEIGDNRLTVMAGIAVLDELEEAGKSGRIARLSGFGEKTQQRILEGIADHREHVGRFLLPEVERHVEPLLDYLRQAWVQNRRGA